MTKAFGHAFADAALLEQSLTHRSAGRCNNERMEFLGDGLINLLVAELIYEKFPRADEGEMTRMRAAVVNGAALATVARAEGIGERLRLGPGEMKTGGHRRESILADALEAIFAAIYLDGGFDACRARVREVFADSLHTAALHPAKDAKTRLQETLQARGLDVPVYELLATHGEDHERTFEVACSVAAWGLREIGVSGSRRGAEQIAAERVLRLVPPRSRKATA